ncbi:MAG: VWA domain-containing protein [Propionibacteriaceae bacterium]|nr:VWA domain-containing protein [Propionibacteriaceae bacterium]
MLAAGLLAPSAAAHGDPIVAAPRLNVDQPDQSGNITQPGGGAELTTAMTVTQVNSITDVVFVIDTTESMDSALAAVKAGLAQFTQNLANAGGTDLAFGVFAFGDTSTGIWSQWSLSLTPLTSTFKVNDVVLALSKAPRFAGGDGPEDSLLALATVAAETPWREGSQREIVLVTDWGSHVRNCPNWCINGMKADLAGVQALVSAANAHVTVLPINQGYTAMDRSDVPLVDLAGAFGNPALVEPAWYALVARLTNDVIMQGAVSPITVTGNLTITYADGTTSSDVTATVTPSGDTTISPGTPVSFKVQATASANPIRPGATTTVCVEYKLAGTDTVVARQTITFTAPSAVTIVLHDDDSNTTVAPSSGFVSSYTGNPGDTFSFTATDAAAGFDGSKYVFVSLNPVTSFTSDPQTVTVHLKHLLIDSAVTSSRTIHYTGAGALTPADHVDSVSWTKRTDAVTSAVTGCTTTSAGYPAVTSPTVAGYTVDRATVAAEAAPTSPSSCPPADSATTVTYTVIPTGITIVFHDDDSNTTVTPVSGFVATRTGNPGDTFSFTATDAAAGFDGAKYVFVSLNPVTSFTFDAQTVTVHLKHLLLTSPVTSSRTIHYMGAGSLTPGDHVDSVSWTRTTDVVTSAVTGCTTTSAGYPAVTSPTVAGYTVDRATVAAEPAPTSPATCPPANSSTTVTYTVIPTGITIVFHDDDSNTTVAPVSGFVSSYTGNPGDTFSFTATDAAVGFDGAKYVFVSLNPITSFTFDAQTVTVHLKHLLIDSTATSSRTIHYTGAETLTPADHMDSVTWTKTTDAVTSAVTGCTTTATGYPAVTSPSVTGYTVDRATVAAEAAPVNPTSCPPADSSTTVTYTLIPSQSVDIVFHDDDLNTSVDPLPGFNTVLTGQVGSSITFSQADAEQGFDTEKYSYVSMNNVTTRMRDSQTITVHLSHRSVTSSVMSSRTIRYTGAGSLTPVDHVDDVSWTKTTDAVTLAVTGCTTTSAGYPAVTSPSVAGFTVDRATVAAEAAPVSPASCPPANSSTTVTYTVIPTAITIVFHDDASDQDVAPVAGFVATRTGDPGDVFSFTGTDAAPGFDATKYVLDHIDNVQVFTFAAQTVTVHLKHVRSVAHVNVNRTIHYRGAGAATPADVVQAIVWEETTDAVTGVCTCAAGSTDYPAVTSPAVAGFEADPVAVPTLAVEATPTTCPPPSVETTVLYTQKPIVVQTGGSTANLGTGMLVAIVMGLSGAAMLWLRRRATMPA